MSKKGNHMMSMTPEETTELKAMRKDWIELAAKGGMNKMLAQKLYATAVVHGRAQGMADTIGAVTEYGIERGVEVLVLAIGAELATGLS